MFIMLLLPSTQWLEVDTPTKKKLDWQSPDNVVRKDIWQLLLIIDLFLVCNSFSFSSVGGEKKKQKKNGAEDSQCPPDPRPPPFFL